MSICTTRDALLFTGEFQHLFITDARVWQYKRLAIQTFGKAKLECETSAHTWPVLNQHLFSAELEATYVMLLGYRGLFRFLELPQAPY